MTLLIGLGLFLSGLLLGGIFIGAAVLAGREEDVKRAWQRGFDDGKEFAASLNGIDARKRFEVRS